MRSIERPLEITISTLRPESTFKHVVKALKVLIGAGSERAFGKRGGKDDKGKRKQHRKRGCNDIRTQFEFHN